jgi:hypothetical protein
MRLVCYGVFVEIEIDADTDVRLTIEEALRTRKNITHINIASSTMMHNHKFHTVAELPKIQRPSLTQKIGP